MNGFEQISDDSERTKRLVAMGEMAASLAHEIRNPLGSMELFCSLLKKDLAQQPDLLFLAEQIHRSIRSLDQVIANSLQFVRSSTPKRKQLSDIKGLLDDVVLNSAAKADAGQLKIQVEVYGAGAVHADPFQIQQALLNLVINGIDATIENRKPGQDGLEQSIVLKSVVASNGDWELSVCDQGVGISEEDCQRIFDPFYTKKAQGTGLGLAIVYSVVVAHGGTINVESVVGCGTTVTLRIPAYQEESR